MDPKDESCIIPEIKLEEAERLSPVRTRKVRLVKKLLSHSSTLPLILASATALRTLMCGALSNALTKSNDKSQMIKFHTNDQKG